MMCPYLRKNTLKQLTVPLNYSTRKSYFMCLKLFCKKKKKKESMMIDTFDYNEFFIMLKDTKVRLPIVIRSVTIPLFYHNLVVVLEYGDQIP